MRGKTKETEWTCIEPCRGTLTWPVPVHTIHEGYQRSLAFPAAARCLAHKQLLLEVHLELMETLPN